MTLSVKSSENQKPTLVRAISPSDTVDSLSLARLVRPSMIANTCEPSPGKPVPPGRFGSHCGSTGRSPSCGGTVRLVCLGAVPAGAPGALGIRTVARVGVCFGFSVQAVVTVAGLVAAPVAVSGMSRRPIASAAKLTVPGPLSWTGEAAPESVMVRSPVLGNGLPGAVRSGQVTDCLTPLCRTTTESSAVALTVAAPMVLRSPSATCGMTS